MLSRNVFIAQAAGFCFSEINNHFHPRSQKNLSGWTAENIGFWCGSQNHIQAIRNNAGVHVCHLNQLGNDSFWLFDESKKDMLRINLVVTVSLNDLSGAGSHILRPLRKLIKSHHIVLFLIFCFLCNGKHVAISVPRNKFSG